MDAVVMPPKQGLERGAVAGGRSRDKLSIRIVRPLHWARQCRGYCRKQ
jgi:hypothetical protein